RNPSAPRPPATANPIPLFAPVTSAVFFSVMRSMLRGAGGSRPRPIGSAVIPARYECLCSGRGRHRDARAALLHGGRRPPALRAGGRAAGDRPASAVTGGPAAGAAARGPALRPGPAGRRTHGGRRGAAPGGTTGAVRRRGGGAAYPARRGPRADDHARDQGGGLPRAAAGP